MPDKSFMIFPAIDLRNGKVVRLAQGDPKRQTSYGDDPAYWTEHWLSQGVDWLHVINLDGAFGDNDSANLQALRAILKVAVTFGARVELGGGIRDRSHIQAALELGVDRLFLGTAAIQNPTLVDWAIAAYGPQRIAGDIGVQDGRVMIQGWQEHTALTIIEVGARFRNQGITYCVLTDVKRDGVSTGVDVTRAVELQTATALQVVASGGVASLEDVRQTRDAGLAGVIIGRALYEGKITIADCRRML